MHKLNNSGSALSVVIISILSFLLIGSLIFGGWAYSERQSYKNDVDKKIDQAVLVAQQRISTAKDNEFAEKEKQPLRTYNGPDTYGGVVIKYPKTWSAYVDQNATNQPLDGYYHPATVPGVRNESTYALRLQVVSSSYSDVMGQYDSLIGLGTVRVSAYRAPKVRGTLGSRIEGQIVPDKEGVMVVLPLRDKTLKIWTESPQYVNDLNKHVLENLTFSP